MRLALGIAVTVALSLSAPATKSAENYCGSGGIWGTNCTVDNTGTQIDIGATIRDPGAVRDAGAESSADPAGDEAGDEPATTPCRITATEFCRGNYSTARLPQVTLDDLASFRPAPPAVASEPAGIGLAGMPTNLVTSASAHTVTGELFGYAVTVRFTPVAYVFDHGDGTSRRSSTGGATWRELGQADFTPTATSHSYADRGVYGATAAVDYAAQVDFGGGWRSVPGTLTLASPAYEVRIVEARTALVARTCLEDPSGPGC